MPPRNYSSVLDRPYENEEEKIKVRKERDNIQQKIAYWRRSPWNFDVRRSDYDDFNKYSKEISKIKNIHNFFCNFNKNDIKTEEELHLYGKFYKQIEFVYKNPDAVAYIKTLKKINDDKLKDIETESSESDC